MAVIKQDFNVMYLPAAIQRNNPIPLDSTAVWYSYDEMANYAATDATAYVGQILSLVNDNVATAYIILNANGDLQQIGSSVVADDKTIVLNDGAFMLKDFGKRYYRYDENTASYILQEVNETYPWIAGLEPKVTSEEGQLVLGWYEPNSTTIEGVNSALSTLQTTVSDLTDEVNEVKAGLSNTYTKDETDSAILNAIANAGHLTYKKVSSLGDIQTDIDNNEPNLDKIIYLVPGLEGLSPDIYDEYMVIDGTIERLGSLEVNLDNYATKDDLDKKVDAVDGYGLISDTDTAKLLTVEVGAEKNFISSVSDNFDVDDNGKLEIVSIPSTIDLSSNETLLTMNALLTNKVNQEDGKSLVADDQIEKLANLPSDAEKNVINGVTSEFSISDDRILSIVSISGSKIENLNENKTFSDLVLQVNTNVTDISDLQTSLEDLNIDLTLFKNQVASTYVTQTDHQKSIDDILAMLTWQDLEEPTA